MSEVFIVYATTDDGVRTALHAFAERKTAEMFVERGRRVWYDSDGHPHMSPEEVLNVRLSVVALRVREGL